MADAIGTTAGAILGTSTVTTYVESAAGVTAGGKTGMTAFVTAICFAVALFFSPVFLAIPGAATAPALILVGLYMLEPIKQLDFSDFSESIPAFICIISMPLAYSIAEDHLECSVTYSSTSSAVISKNQYWHVCTGVLFILKYIFI